MITKAWVDREARRIARRRAIERGEELLRLRVEAGVTLREAGAIAGVDWSYIARIERAAVDPSVDVLTRLGLVYGAVRTAR